MSARGPRETGADDAGVALPFVAASLLALCAMAAIGVDLAHARSVQLDAAAAADQAAIAAAFELPDTVAAADVAMDYAAANFDTTAQDWADCADDRALPIAAPGTACISFETDFTQVRVRVPDRPVGTSFGRVVGVDTIDVGAAARAGQALSGSNRVIPATIAGNLGSGLLCIENSGNDTACAARTTGSFGSIDSPRTRTYFPTSALDPNSQAINYAMSMDHSLEIYDPANSAVCDGDNISPCETSILLEPSSVPNHVVLSVGNDVPPVTEGYVTGFEINTSDQGVVSFCGRLSRPDYTAENLQDPRPAQCQPDGPTIQVAGTTINGRHAYQWMHPASRSLFYPELNALNIPPLGDAPPATDPIYSAGDARLNCFLQGYSYDPATGVETIPDCSASGLVVPSNTLTLSWEHLPITEVDGGCCEALPTTSWIETGDDGDPATGALWINTDPFPGTGGGGYVFDGSAADLAGIERHFDFSGRPDVTYYPGFSFENQISSSTAQLVFQVSADGGTTWSDLNTLNSANTNVAGYGWSMYKVERGGQRAFLGPNTIFRFEKRGIWDPALDTVKIRRLDIEWNEEVAASPVAPIFDAGMRNDPRFGVIPKVTAFPTQGQAAAPIEGFWFTFTYNVYATNTKVKGFDAWVFDPALIGADPTAPDLSYGFAPDPVVRLLE